MKVLAVEPRARFPMKQRSKAGLNLCNKLLEEALKLFILMKIR